MVWPRKRSPPTFSKLLATLLLAQIGILLIPAVELSALPKSMRFWRLSTEEGLSQGSVHAIFQDSRGFMWFGTQDGLNRYDGHTVTLYKHDPQGPDSLAHNHVWALCEDDSGDLWIGTDGGGLDRWDRGSDTFTHHRHHPEDPASLSGDRVRALWLDGSGILWIGTAAAGISRLDPATATFSSMRSDPGDPASLSDDRILSLFEDRSGALWIGTRGGLNRLDRATRQFVRYRHDPSEPSSLNDDHVRAIHQDSTGTLWVGTAGGLHRLERDSGSFFRYTHDPRAPSSLSDNRVRAVLEDRDGRLWVATDAGLNLLEPGTGTFDRYAHESGEPTSLSHDSILSLYQDRGGILWVGTLGGGVDRWDPATWSFPHYRSRPKEPHGLSSDAVMAFSEDAAGDLWIGTFGGGLNRWRRDSGELVHYRNDPADPTSLGDDRVMALIHDRFGQLWAGTRGSGLDRFDPASRRFTHYAHDPAKRDSLSDDQITSLFEDREGTLWIGTFGGGLDRFDRQSEGFVAFRHESGDPTSLSDDRVTCLTEDGAGRLWIGTDGGGLNRFDAGGGVASDRERRSFERYRHQDANRRSLASDAIMSLFVDPAGTLWVGTRGGGLDRLDDLTGQPAEAVFRNYSERDGLPNASVFGIHPDGNGRLWLSTSDGLARFDPRSETFKSYDTSHGLQNDDFFFGAHYSSPSGEMFFGGISGFNAFFPERVERDAYVPPVVITAFLKRNKPVALGRPTYDLRELELSHRDSVFSFEFAALDYTAPERNRYAYMLEGFDEDWIELEKRRPVTYTNLGPGDYLFRVKASSSTGVWNEQGAAMAIRIIPSPWKTWWAYLGYALVATAVAYGGLQWHLRGLRRRGEELASTVRQRTAELSLTVDRLRISERTALEAKEGALEERKKALEANRAKSTFLSHMSHELRTPLNAVLGFARLMERDRGLSGEHRESLAIIRRSGEHLLGLIDDVLSFSKIEAGKQTLNERCFDPHRLLLEIERMIRLRAETKGLTLDFDLAPDLPGSVRGDDRKLRQVLLNLLGNAVKFTDHGVVSLRARWRDEIAELEITDTGRGIPEEELDRLFEPFEQTGSGRFSIGGTGLGLAISRKLVRMLGGELEVASVVAEGSTFGFAIRLPAGGEVSLPAEPRRVLRLAPDQPRLRILVVDDAEDNRILLRRLLAQVGFEVREATTGGEALEIWESWRPHLIWMDMRMPVMDGCEATRRLRHAESKRAGDRTAIIALTATAFEHDRSKALAAGCDEMVTKPFREEAIFDQLAEHLGARFVYEEARPVAAVSDGSPVHGSPVPVGSDAGAAAGLIDLEKLEQLRTLEAREPKKGLVSRLLGSFLDTSPLRLDGIQQAVAACDDRQLQDLAHTLKGSSSSVGAVRVAAICADLERLGKDRALDEGGSEVAQAALAELDFELERAMKALSTVQDSA